MLLSLIRRFFRSVPKTRRRLFSVHPHLLLFFIMALITGCSSTPLERPNPGNPKPNSPNPSPSIDDQINSSAEVSVPTSPALDETPTSESPPKDKDATTDIILLLPLSGEDAALGQSLLNTITLALYDIGPSPVRLVPIDTKSDIITLETALPTIIAAKPAAIIGPVDSQLSRFLTTALNTPIENPAISNTKNAIPVFSLSDDPNAAAPGHYIVGIPVETEVRHIVAHAIRRKDDRFASLIPLGPYGDRVGNALGIAMEESGGTLDQSERYPRLADSVYDPVKALTRYDARKKALDDEVRFLQSLRDDLTDEIAADLAEKEALEAVSYNAVLLAEGGSLLRTLAPLFPFYEVDQTDARLYGTGLFSSGDFRNEPTLIGARFAGPSPRLSAGFADRFAALFGYRPQISELVAYDAAAFVFKQMLDLSPEKDLTKRIEAASGYQGLTGLFRFWSSGRIERSLAILEITPQGLIEAEPALETFPQFGNALSGVFRPLDD